MFLPLFNSLFVVLPISVHATPIHSMVQSKSSNSPLTLFHTPLTPFVCQQLFQFCFQNIESSSSPIPGPLLSTLSQQPDESLKNLN